MRTAPVVPRRDEFGAEVTFEQRSTSLHGPSDPNRGARKQHAVRDPRYRSQRARVSDRLKSRPFRSLGQPFVFLSSAKQRRLRQREGGHAISNRAHIFHALTPVSGVLDHSAYARSPPIANWRPPS